MTDLPVTKAPDDLVERLIRQHFLGFGAALRREEDAPIPGEPFISMEDAKNATRMVVERLRSQLAAAEVAAEAQLQTMRKALKKISKERRVHVRSHSASASLASATAAFVANELADIADEALRSLTDGKK